MDHQPRPFVPALGHAALTRHYDRVLALMTREAKWRARLRDAVAAAPGETILDVGCGTGTFALMLKRACPRAQIIGVDPDETVLAMARAKSASAGLTVDWRLAMGDALASAVAGPVDKIASSLVLHQCDSAMKAAICRAMHQILMPGGKLLIADYGRQHGLGARLLFSPVRMLDGYDNTRLNARGALPGIIGAAGFVDVEETWSLLTPTGTITLYSAHRP